MKVQIIDKNIKGDKGIVIDLDISEVTVGEMEFLNEYFEVNVLSY